MQPAPVARTQPSGGSVLSLPLPMPVHSLCAAVTLGGEPVVAEQAGGLLGVCGMGWPWTPRRLCVAVTGLQRHLRPGGPFAGPLGAPPGVRVCGAVPTVDGAAVPPTVVRTAAGSTDRGVAIVTTGGLGHGAAWLDLASAPLVSTVAASAAAEQLAAAQGAERPDTPRGAAASDPRATSVGQNSAASTSTEASSDRRLTAAARRRLAAEMRSSSSSSSASDDDAAPARRPHGRSDVTLLEPAGAFVAAPPPALLPDVADAMPTADGAVWWCLGAGSNVVTYSAPGAPTPNTMTTATEPSDRRWSLPFNGGGDGDFDDSDDDDNVADATVRNSSNAPPSSSAPTLPFDAMVLPGPGRWGFAPAAHGFGTGVAGHPGAAVAVGVDALRFAVLDPRLPGLPAAGLLPVLPARDRLSLGVGAVAVTDTGVVVVGTASGSMLLFDLRRAGSTAERPMTTIELPRLPGPDPQPCIRHVSLAPGPAAVPPALAVACSDAVLVGTLDEARGAFTGLGGPGADPVAITTGSNVTAVSMLACDADRRAATVAIADDEPAVHVWRCFAAAR